MMIRFFPHGQGGGGPAINYLLAQEVPAYDSERRRIPGEVEIRDPHPLVLRGDASRTAHLIDGIRRKWRYTSGVLAFAAEDRPTQAELDAVMDGFEGAAFAGLEADQYDCLWVQHTHKGNIELHFVVPRTELYDGAAFNIAPPRSESYFNAFRDYWNSLKGWASPDDPDRRRTLKHVFESKDRTAVRNAVRAHVITKIELGKVRNHTDVLAALAELEADGLEIKPPRPAKKTPSKPSTKVVVRRIGSTGTSETYRLTDRLFHSDWTVDEFLAAKNSREDRERDQGRRREGQRRVEVLQRQLETAIRRRADSNRKRFDRSRRALALRLGTSAEGDTGSGRGGAQNNAGGTGQASTLEEQGRLALHSDADGDRRGFGGGDGDPRVRDHASTGSDTGRDPASPERTGAISEGGGIGGSGDGLGTAGRSDRTTLPTDDAPGSSLRQNAKNGELSYGNDPYGARIAEICQSVDRAIQRIRDSHQAFSREDREDDKARHTSFGLMREVFGRVSAAIGRLVQSISGGSCGRWFRDESIGASPTTTGEQVERARLKIKPTYGPSGP